MLYAHVATIEGCSRLDVEGFTRSYCDRALAIGRIRKDAGRAIGATPDVRLYEVPVYDLVKAVRVT